MTRIASFLYGVLCYALGLGTLLSFAGFLSNGLVPNPIDASIDPLTHTTSRSIATNLALLTAFALQHSGMARPAFKRVWTHIVPEPIERSTYVLCSSVALLLVMAGWQPMPERLWHFESGPLQATLIGAFGIGLVLILSATWMIDHFHFFGLRQVYTQLKRRPVRDDDFVTPSLYRHIRHPLYLGWLITLWATPSMTAGHLLLAAATSVYILIAVQYEERDLITAFGRRYERYRESTPAFLPRTRSTEAGRGRAHQTSAV